MRTCPTVLSSLSSSDSEPDQDKALHFFFQELDSVNKLITDGKAKANDIRNNLKNLETTSTRFVVDFNI